MDVKSGNSKRLMALDEFRQYVATNDEIGSRTDTLTLAKALALAGLPKRKTREKVSKKIIRLGKEHFIQVTYGTTSVLPYGQDRIVLAALQDLALRQNSPVVYFKTAGEILSLFGVQPDGRSYDRLRKRLSRIKDVWISITFARRKEDLGDSGIGENMLAVKKFFLPNKREVMRLRESTASNKDFDYKNPYGVVLSDDFFEYLKNSKNQLLAPINLLRPFKDSPTGWDFLLFLIARCGAARKTSAIAHEDIIPFFRDGKEADRDVIRKLEKYLIEIKHATKNRIKAYFVEDGNFPSSGRGRRKKRWKLIVEPKDEWFVWSGRKQNLKKREISSKKNPASEVDTKGDLNISKLIESGVASSVAKGLVKEYSDEIISSNISYFKHLQKGSNEIRNPSGFLVQSIKSDYAKRLREEIKTNRKNREIEESLVVKNEIKFLKKQYFEFLKFCVWEELEELDRDFVMRNFDEEFLGKFSVFSEEIKTEDVFDNFLNKIDYDRTRVPTFDQWAARYYGIQLNENDGLDKVENESIRLYLDTFEAYLDEAINGIDIYSQKYLDEYLKDASRYNRFLANSGSYDEIHLMKIAAEKLEPPPNFRLDICEFVKDGWGVDLIRTGSGYEVWDFSLGP